MKNIIIALDYNDSARKVADAGYELAKAAEAELTLIHVITEPAFYAQEYSPIAGYQGGYTSGTIEIVDDIKKEAINFLSVFVTSLGNNSIQTAVLEGNTADEIIKYAEDNNADLIVMGSHRHKGLAGLLMPDTTIHIVKHSKIPLLIIPTLD